ncbi:MAG: hypothetical protein ABIH21_04510, partial [Patescibacteria group bacterium]
MSKTPNYDQKVKAILDATQPGERTCAMLGTKWFMDQKEIEQYKKYNVPPSKFHPITRMKLMKSFFVLFDMWYNKHAETGETIISTTHPASGVKVLPDIDWFSREFTKHAKDVDMNRSVFDQIYEMTRAVPQAANYNYVLPENSLAFISLGDQDSYFVLASQTKHCFYCMNAYESEDSAELTLCTSIQNSYNVCHSQRIFNCRFVRESYDCMSCDFIFDCRNCENCFGATNKRNKKFIWMNQQLSEDEWKKRKAKVDLSSWSSRQEYESKFKELMSKAIWPENFNIKAENCTGDYIVNANNVTNGYYVVDGTHDMDYVSFAFAVPSNDCYLTIAPVGATDCYYSLGTKNCSWCRFGISILSNCINIEYCSSCKDLENCFGCVGLKKKKFCIFNKQYSEDEYWKTLDELKCKMLDDGEYGDYPPMNFTLQYVKGSGAPIVYGATDDEMKKMGANFFEPGAEGAEGPTVNPAELTSTDTIPDKLENPEDIVGKPYFDDIYGRRYGYIRAEIDLYSRLGVAVPRKHPTRRINELYAQMNMAVFEDKQ